MDTGEYSVEGDAESFFDLNADELDDTLGGDEETFGDLGPLNDDWQFSHDKFARIVEDEKTNVPPTPIPAHHLQAPSSSFLGFSDAMGEELEPEGDRFHSPPTQTSSGHPWNSPAPPAIWGSHPSTPVKSDSKGALSNSGGTSALFGAAAALPAAFANLQQPQHHSADPLSKLFSGLPPNAHQFTAPIGDPLAVAVSSKATVPPPMPKGRVLSAEELEARLTGGPSSPSTPSIFDSLSIQSPNASQLPTPANFSSSNQGWGIPPSSPTTRASQGSLLPGLPSQAQTNSPLQSPQRTAGGTQLPLPLPSEQQHFNQQSAFGQQTASHPFFQQQNYPISRRWKESKKMMTADEIDNIIRVQSAQIQTDNPYVDDFYYLNSGLRQMRKTGNNHVVVNHNPICESTPRPQRKQTDQPPGVLGRIPSHSVRAPRPLLQVKGSGPSGSLKATEDPEQQDQDKALSYAIVLTIEEAFNCVLDAEDLDNLISSPNARDQKNVTYLYTKRLAITDELFKLLSVYVPKQGALPDEHQLPDNILIKLLLVTKGKKLLSRVIPLLFQEQFQYLFLFFMRNLSVLQILFSQQSMDMDEEKAINQLFDNVTSKTASLVLPHLIYALDTLTFYHSTSLLELFQSEKTLQVLTAILHRASSLASPNLRTELDAMYIMQWHNVFSLFSTQVLEVLPVLFTCSPQIGESRSFTKFANSLYTSSDEGQKQRVLQVLALWNAQKRAGY